MGCPRRAVLLHFPDTLWNDCWKSPGEMDEEGWLEIYCIWLFDRRPVVKWNEEIDDPQIYRFDYSGVCRGAFQGLGTVCAGMRELAGSGR